MIGGISHYFNNVFTGILGNLSLAGIDAPEGLSPFIGNAAHAADRARTFTRQLLSLSRKSVVVLEPTDIGALIEDVESFARLTFDRRIEIAVAKPDGLHCVLADAASIHHVLLNLCINARDAIEEKHVTLAGMTEPRITIEARNETIPVRCDADRRKSHGTGHPDARSGRHVRITVSDNGCGMDEESIKRIFEPYYTTKEPGKGTGLGLTVALETIRQHNGWIECASTAGQGSAFTVYLPATSLKKEISGERKIVDLPPGTERILFVDDEEMVRTFGILTLERLGYSVLSASNGREALDLYIREHGSIDLVILDLGLPVLSGQELLKHIRLINRDVTVLVLSGHDFVHDRDVFGELRADDYILKPFTIYDLAASVRAVLDRKSGR
ncbi:response regulator [bacterium]|nr:response regulator [bacterium]